MKKFIALLLALTMLASFAGCATTPAETQSSSTPSEPSTPSQPVDDPAVKGEGVMTYAEYDAAAMDSEVVIETYVQAKQGWWEKDGVGVATFYTQDLDGAYFLYNMPCSKEDYDKMVAGAKLKVTGYKGTWDGIVEVMDATYEILEGSYIAPAMDATDLLESADLIKHMNKFVSFKGMTVVAANDAGDAFMYKWDGSGKEGDDLYFKVSLNDKIYSFCVESYLCGKDTDVYKAVQAWNVGDKVDLEGFLYWYLENAQPHITSVKAAA